MIDTDGEAPVLEIWGEWCTYSLRLLLGLLSYRVVVSVTLPCKNEIEMFKNYLYSIRPFAKKMSTQKM